MVERKPDKEFLTAFREHQKGVWGDTHADWKRIDEFLDLSYKVWQDDDDTPSIHPPDSISIIHHAVDNLITFEPVVRRVAIGVAAGKEERADQVEQALESILLEANLLEPSLTWKQVGFHLAAYGYTVVEGPLWNTRGSRQKPKRKDYRSKIEFDAAMTLWENDRKSYMPIRVRAPHPSSIMMNFRDKRPDEGIKLAKRYVVDIQRLKNSRLDDDNASIIGEVNSIDLPDDPYEEVETLEYWSRDWHGFMVGEEVLFVEPNIWGLMPYKHAFSGRGHEPTSGGVSSMIKPRHLAVGLLHPVTEVIRSYAQELSTRHNAYVNSGFFDIVTTMDADELREQMNRQGRQRILEKTDGNDVIEPFQMPNLPQWMLEAEMQMRDAVERGTFSSASMGIRQNGVSTVGQQAILSNAAAKVFLPMVRQLEHMASLVSQDILRLIEIKKESVYSRGHELNTRMISNDYNVIAEFPQKDPALDLQERQIAMQELTLGLIDTETYQTIAGRENISGIRKGIIKDQIRQLPAVQQLLMITALEEMGLMEAAEMMKAQMGGSIGQTAQQPQQPGTLLGPNGHPQTEMTGNGQQAMLRQNLTNEVQNPPRQFPS